MARYIPRKQRKSTPVAFPFLYAPRPLPPVIGAQDDARWRAVQPGDTVIDWDTGRRRIDRLDVMDLQRKRLH